MQSRGFERMTSASGWCFPAGCCPNESLSRTRLFNLKLINFCAAVFTNCYLMINTVSITVNQKFIFLYFFQQLVFTCAPPRAAPRRAVRVCVFNFVIVWLFDCWSLSSLRSSVIFIRCNFIFAILKTPVFEMFSICVKCEYEIHMLKL